MTPGRDTDPDGGWTEPSPLPPPPPLPKRQRRDSVATVAGRAIAAIIKKGAPYAGALVIALLSLWTKCIDERAERAREKATAAEKVSAAGEVTADKRFDATKEKLDQTGQVTVQVAAELKALRDEIDKLKAEKMGRPKPRPAAAKTPPVVKVPPVVAKDLADPAQDAGAP